VAPTLGAVQEADIVDLAHDGRGVARVDGKAVFIDGALPSEHVSLRIHKRRRHMDEAGLVKVLAASPDRVVPRCEHFGLCGGCSLQHLSPSAQLAAKQRQLLENLQRIGNVEPTRVLEPLRGPEWAYRRRARLGIKYVHKKGRVLAGFREREKPYIADIKRCEILLAPLAQLPEELAALVETLEIREKLPQVDAMSFVWTGKFPPNRCPKMKSFTSAVALKSVAAGSTNTAKVEVADPESDPLAYEWSAVSESTDRKTGGDAELTVSWRPMHKQKAIVCLCWNCTRRAVSDKSLEPGRASQR